MLFEPTRYHQHNTHCRSIQHSIDPITPLYKHRSPLPPPPEGVQLALGIWHNASARPHSLIKKLKLQSWTPSIKSSSWLQSLQSSISSLIIHHQEIESCRHQSIKFTDTSISTIVCHPHYSILSKMLRIQQNIKWINQPTEWRSIAQQNLLNLNSKSSIFNTGHKWSKNHGTQSKSYNQLA